MLKYGGKLILSVMNMELTYHRIKSDNKLFDINEKKNIEKLIRLCETNTMSTTGDIFNGDNLLIDIITGIIYHKEEFITKDSLPFQCVVRDGRYSYSGIKKMCNMAGFNVVDEYGCLAGKFDKPMYNDKKHAKEIFLILEKKDLVYLENYSCRFSIILIFGHLKRLI